MKILYHQAADLACMHTYDILQGLNLLGHEVYSNILNYDFLKPHRGEDYDAKIVSTSGAVTTLYKPDPPYLFIDGRDTEEVETLHLLGAKAYFKANSISPMTQGLPTCIDPKWLKEPSEGRLFPATFLTGHGERGRDKVIEWAKKAHVYTNFVARDRTALNKHYPPLSCNIYSQSYHDTLQNSTASINAPGGGVMTKRFFEIIASGAVCLNYTPKDYHQATGNILRVIPEILKFPEEAVLSFSDEKEFNEALGKVNMDLAWKTYDWAKSWTFKEKAAYVLSMV